MDGAPVGIIQARGAAWPFHVWFKERDQACCCKVPPDSLLASTVKAWVLELHVGLSFYQWNNSSDVAALSHRVWTLSSCHLSSPAGQAVYAGSANPWKARSKETIKTLWAQIRALIKFVFSHLSHLSASPLLSLSRSFNGIYFNNLWWHNIAEAVCSSK